MRITKLLWQKFCRSMSKDWFQVINTETETRVDEIVKRIEMVMNT